MKIITTLFAMSLMLGCVSVTQASGCADGSEPVKSISADGSYFVYNCGGSSSVDNSVTTINTTKSGTVSLSSDVQQSTTTGNWFPDDIMYSPHFVKRSNQFRKKSYTTTHWNFADFDNDGVQDFFIITNANWC